MVYDYDTWAGFGDMAAPVLLSTFGNENVANWATNGSMGIGVCAAYKGNVTAYALGYVVVGESSHSHNTAKLVNATLAYGEAWYSYVNVCPVAKIGADL